MEGGGEAEKQVWKERKKVVVGREEWIVGGGRSVRSVREEIRELVGNRLRGGKRVCL